MILKFVLMGKLFVNKIKTKGNLMLKFKEILLRESSDERTRVTKFKKKHEAELQAYMLMARNKTDYSILSGDDDMYWVVQSKYAKSYTDNKNVRVVRTINVDKEAVDIAQRKTDTSYKSDNQIYKFRTFDQATDRAVQLVSKNKTDYCIMNGNDDDYWVVQSKDCKAIENKYDVSLIDHIRTTKSQKADDEKKQAVDTSKELVKYFQTNGIKFKKDDDFFDLDIAGGKYLRVTDLNTKLIQLNFVPISTTNGSNSQIREYVNSYTKQKVTVESSNEKNSIVTAMEISKK